MSQTDGLAILPIITHGRSLQQCHTPHPQTRRVVTLAGIVQVSLPKLRWDLPCVLNLNARSLSMEKINELEVIITDFNVSIACVTETWFKRTLSPYFRNLPLLHITIRLHLTSRLLKFMQWLARKQYVLCSW